MGTRILVCYKHYAITRNISWRPTANADLFSLNPCIFHIFVFFQFRLLLLVHFFPKTLHTYGRKSEYDSEWFCILLLFVHPFPQTSHIAVSQSVLLNDLLDSTGFNILSHRQCTWMALCHQRVLLSVFWDWIDKGIFSCKCYIQSVVHVWS